MGSYLPTDIVRKAGECWSVAGHMIGYEAPALLSDCLPELLSARLGNNDVRIMRLFEI
jgi:hypothetical protein